MTYVDVASFNARKVYRILGCDVYSVDTTLPIDQQKYTLEREGATIPYSIPWKSAKIVINKGFVFLAMEE